MFYSFTIPFVKTETASRAFSVYAPKLINSLPKHIRDRFSSDPVAESVSVDCFKHALKIFLCQSVFADVV